jgi:hypothetical protein
MGKLGEDTYFQGRTGSRIDHFSLKISIDGCVDPASC